MTAQSVPVQSEKLAAASFGPVPGDSISDTSGYGNAQPGPVSLPRTVLENKIPVLESLSGPRQPKKFGAFQKSVCFGKRKVQKRSPGCIYKCCPVRHPDMKILKKPFHRGYDAARRFLPLARRFLISRRPPFVDIRFRKPWFLARLILLG